MENIDTLLAAVAQSQGLGDEGAEEVKVAPKPRQVAGERKKRGRACGVPRISKRIKPEDEEEDVCFICFDGGSLVLCDCKGCPKAYHPTCIKRDEAFFQSTAKWYCGWHICSVCRKASHYSCYTCSYSLCKGCAKDADYSSVRKKKGFCSICMKTIMLLENKDQANNEPIQVDFDDITSWEYLFKVYWVALKDKLSLTLDELTRAQKPSKGVGTIVCKPPSSDYIPNAVSAEVHISDSAKTEKSQVKASIDQDTEMKKEPDKARTDGCSSSTEWATKDLLEFVAHVKNGDTSALSQFDAQMLLLDYVKRNNLRDPRRKSQIICDQRLRILFGKQRVGHIEMLKLLESHFLVKEDSKKSEMSVDGNTYEPPMPINSRKRKTRRKSDEKAPAQNNLKEYAAVDVHNINLLYLKQSLMENLLEDREGFTNKVVGTIVRIRISSDDQKQDVHRLVQVVGTTKVDEPYKIGDMATDVMLEVLNLDKKEVVPVTDVSNDEFTEDECMRLRQSMRLGLAQRLTVGEVQNKAMSLHPMRVNNCLEAEISRLNDLRDRARENGRKKEIRRIASKLHRLKLPEQHSRRISKIPKIHTDPKMSPNYEPGEDAKSGKASYSDVPQNGRKSVSFNKKDKAQRMIRARSRVREKPDASGSSMSDKRTNQVVIETEKLWHYRDPNGKIQGPFSMMQLRKWSTTGLFPPDMTIWTNHEQNDSILLTYALNEKEKEATGEIGLIHEVTNASIGDSNNNASVSSENNPGLVRAEESGSWPQCWDLLKDNDVQELDLPPSLSPDKMHKDLQPRNGEKNPTLVTEENLIIPNGSEENASFHPSGDISLLDLSSPTPRTIEIDDVAMPSFEILELLSPAPRPNDEDQLTTETKQSEFIKFSGLGEEWCGYSPTPEQEQPPVSSGPSWRVRINGIIEIDAFGEETVSDLFDEAAAKQLREASLPSPTSAVKFARELEDCKDNDCFSSIEELSRKGDTFSSEGETVNNALNVDPMRGNINLVTVQGNVNLVLGQGMTGLGWANPDLNQRMMYGSPREWGCWPPWGRQQQYGGGYSRQILKGKRVCKFYGSGHCKKGAFCDYLHQ